MMEHVKNYEALLEKVSRWLSPTGLFFVHIFTHKTLPFHYTEGWMAENFFSGGQVRMNEFLNFKHVPPLRCQTKLRDLEKLLTYVPSDFADVLLFIAELLLK